MLTNTTITAWRKRTSFDESGQPVLAAQDGGPWAALLQPKTVRLKREGRETLFALAVRVPVDPGFGVGDRVTLQGEEHEVLSAEPVLKGALSHTTLLLG